MNCLISGANGFLGTHLADYLVAQGLQVFGLVRAQSKSSRLNEKVKTYHWPDTDAELAELVQKLKPDLVFHLAGAFYANEDKQNFSKNLDANFTAGFRLANALSSLKSCRLINTASYWEFTGNDQQQANTVYAALKASFRSYLSSLPIALSPQHMSVVVFDVYGAGDWRPKLIPQLLSAAKDHSELELTDGTQGLDLVYVEDVCKGLLTAATEGFENRQLRALSSEKIVTVRELTAEIEKITHSKINANWGKKAFPAHQVYEPIRNISNVRGWHAQVDLSQGIKKCLAL